MFLKNGELQLLHNENRIEQYDFYQEIAALF